MNPVERGTQIRSFRLEERLGQGSFGAVYRVRDVRTGEVRALKLLAPTSNLDERLRFRREAELQAQLDRHPNVLRVHEVGEWQGQDYLVLDYVPGGSLADLLRRGPLPAGQAVAIAIDLARALGHLHAHGVLHRDLKPANVLLTEQGRTLLADFGLARSAASASLTASGAVLGSPLYMSPEQANGESKSLTAAADVYALGGVLFTLLAGRPPFVKASSMLSLLQDVISTPAPPLDYLCPDVDPRLAEVVAACLEKDPARRPPTAGALEQSLLRYLEGGDAGAARPRTTTWAVALGALLLVGALGAGAWQLTRERTTPAREPAVPSDPAVREEQALEQPPDVAPFLERLAAGDFEAAHPAWRELSAQLPQLTEAQLEALEEAAQRHGLEALALDQREFPDLAQLCCEVLGAAARSRPGPASPAFGNAVLAEALRRARKAEAGAAAEGEALDWVQPACVALAKHGVAVVDVDAMPLLDLVWNPNGLRYAGNDSRRVDVLVSLVRVGASPGGDHVTRLPEQSQQSAGDPIYRFLKALQKSLATSPVPGFTPTRLAGNSEFFRSELRRLLDEGGDPLPVVARNVITVWLAHELSAAERVRVLHALAPQIGPNQPRLGYAAALTCLLVPPAEDADLPVTAPQLAQRLVEQTGHVYFEQAVQSKVLSTSKKDTIASVLLTLLANHEASEFRRLHEDCTQSVKQSVYSECPAWLRQSWDDAMQ